jgi:hypothetical protein
LVAETSRAGRIRVLVTVKAYPSIGKKTGESVCVAGIDVATGSWVRLYPLPFRDLPKERQFEKYATIEVDVRPPRNDPRPESRACDIDSLEVVEGPLPAAAAPERRAQILPTLESSMCAIARRQKVDGTSLGVFRPRELLEFVTAPEEAEWPQAKQARLDQGRLIGPEMAPLEKIPHSFSYRYRCEDDGCKGHEQTIIDWEIMQAYRKWRRDHGERRALEMIEDKWAREMWGPERDTFFFTGNQLAHPQSFLVLGTFWPKKPARGGGSSGWVQGELLPPR